MSILWTIYDHTIIDITYEISPQIFMCLVGIKSVYKSRISQWTVSTLIQFSDKSEMIQRYKKDIIIDSNRNPEEQQVIPLISWWILAERPLYFQLCLAMPAAPMLAEHVRSWTTEPTALVLTQLHIDWWHWDWVSPPLLTDLQTGTQLL